MAAKPEKNTGGKSVPKSSKETPKKASSKSKKELEDNDGMMKSWMTTLTLQKTK